MNKTYILPLVLLLGGLMGFVNASTAIEYKLSTASFVVGLLLGHWAKGKVKGADL